MVKEAKKIQKSSSKPKAMTQEEDRGEHADRAHISINSKSKAIRKTNQGKKSESLAISQGSTLEGTIMSVSNPQSQEEDFKMKPSLQSIVKIRQPVVDEFNATAQS